MKRLLVVVLALILGAGTAFAQTSGSEIEIVDINGARYADGGQTTMIVDFRNFIDTPNPELLQITADGQPVSNLEVRTLGESTVPVGTILVIDSSGSMAGAPIDAAKAAAQAFVDQKRPEDQIALVTFADVVTVLSGFTSNGDELTSRIEAIEAVGETAFNDAVIKAVELFDGTSSQNLLKNAIVLTDGEDTASVGTLEEAIAALNDTDIKVFGVALESPDFNPDPVSQIAAAGSGLFLSTPDPEQLSGLYDQIGREISNTLVARFISPISTPGEVAFAASYEGLTSSVTFSVSGYATTTTSSPLASTTVTFAPPSTLVVENTLFLDSTTLILVGAIGLGLTLFLFLVILFGREEEEGGNRFTKRLEAYGRKGPQAEKVPLLQRLPLVKRFSQAAEEEVRKRGLLSGLNSALEQANIPMTPGEAILALFGAAAVGGVILAIFNGPIFGGVAFVFLLVLFIGLINFAGGREKRKFEKQLPDTLTLLATSLRAGYSLLQAVEAVAAEAPDPTAREFGRAMAEARLGRAVGDALQGIAERTQSQDFEWAVMAIEIQREVGGNLAEVLQTVANTMLQRNRLRGEIRALTAEGRLSAIVLGLLPFLMFGFLYSSNREYLQPLLDETLGQVALGFGVLLIAAGIFWLKKIVDIDV
ncbi:MAG: type II secretion system F family protein [Acidimicrobiia bacterium]|nr:type II secretion system F family protein [Acidimicrobiia bacterium]